MLACFFSEHKTIKPGWSVRALMLSMTTYLEFCLQVQGLIIRA